MMPGYPSFKTPPSSFLHRLDLAITEWTGKFHPFSESTHFFKFAVQQDDAFQPNGEHAQHLQFG
jgi:hypothetical protein